MRVSRSRVGAVAAFLLLAFALPASAVWTGVKETTVSCDAVTVKVGITVDHPVDGLFQVFQNFSDPTSSTWVWGYNSRTQANLVMKSMSTGGFATWTDAKFGTYTVKFLRTVSANCNGWLPGHGNYTLKYQVGY